MAKTPQIDYVNIEFQSLQQDLIDYITAQSEFTDQNKQGSNFDLLTGLLAYVTTLLSYNLNQGVNETYLPTAQLRSNILKIIKPLNYDPQRAQPAKIDVNIDVTALETTGTGSGTLRRFDQITSGDFNFYYTGSPLPYTAQTGADFSDIEFQEGTLVQEDNGFTPSLTPTAFQEFTIQDTGIGEFFEFYEYNTVTEEKTIWSEFEAGTIYESPSTAKIYFVEEVEDGYKISFGNGTLGVIPEQQTGITYGYQYIKPDTSGDTNGLDTFTWTGDGEGSLKGIDTATITTSNVSAGADTKESIEEIKFNAPKWYQTQGRAVTAEDYRAIAILNNNVSKAAVVGGETLTPVELGKVYIYTKPTTEIVGDTFTDSQLQDLKKYFEERSVITIEPIVKNPFYVYVSLNITLRYTAESSTPSESDVKAALDTFVNTSNSEFGDYLEFSQLRATIDDADSLITSNLTTKELYYKITDEDFTNATEDGSYTMKLSKKLDTSFTTRIVLGDGSQTGSTLTEGVDYSITYTDAANGDVVIQMLNTGATLGVSDTGFESANLYFNVTDDDVFLNSKQIFILKQDDIDITLEQVTT